MTVRVLRSTDPGAPTLYGALGTMITLLDAVLVNGYTIDAWAATTVYALNAVAKKVASNGRYYKCTTAGTSAGSEPTWPTTLGATVTDGTVVWTDVGLIPTPLGWTKAFSGTNKAAYRMDTGGSSTGSYLRVDDNITSYANRTGLTGYVTMSTVDAGTDPFESVQNYLGICKSATIATTTRQWVMVGDQYRFYLMVQSADNIAAEWDVYFFGDIISYVPNDTYRAMLGARYATSMGSQTYNTNYMMSMGGYSWETNYSMVMPRTHAGVAPRIPVGAHTDLFKGGNLGYGAFMAGSQGPLAYPNVVNGGMFIAPIWIHQATTSPRVVRGYMPGYWAPLHNRPLANNDTFSGVGQMAGKTFEAFYVRGGGEVLIETSDTWS